MNNKQLFLDAVVQLKTEIREITIIAGIFAAALIINIPALQPIWMAGVTYLVSLVLVAVIFLILVMRNNPDTVY